MPVEETYIRKDVKDISMKLWSSQHIYVHASHIIREANALFCKETQLLTMWSSNVAMQLKDFKV